MLKSPIGRLRLIGLVEGASFLILLGVAMPLKYLADMPMAVRIVGSVHGGLFLVFLVALMQAADHGSWRFTRIAAAFIASVLPFGTFVFDRSLRAEAAAEAAKGG